MTSVRRAVGICTRQEGRKKIAHITCNERRHVTEGGPYDYKNKENSKSLLYAFLASLSLPLSSLYFYTTITYHTDNWREIKETKELERLGRNPPSVSLSRRPNSREREKSRTETKRKRKRKRETEKLREGRK